MPRAKQISLNNTLIDIGDGNCEIWDVTKPHGTYSITGHSTPYADITTALNNNTSVVLRHPDGRLFYLAGNFGTGNEARYSFTYNEATTRMIIGIYSNNTITYTTPTGGAPQFHRSTDTTYGIGSENYYGHNKVINNLTTANYIEGESLAAYQGKVLKDAVDGKQASITGGASTITSSNLTASRALVSNGSGKVAVSAVTATELGYLSGAKSNIQSQIDLDSAALVFNSWGSSSTSMTNVSIPSGTTTNAGSFELTKGLYWVTITASWGTNATGYRSLVLSATATGNAINYSATNVAQAVGITGTVQNLSIPLNVASGTATYYIVVRQNSGANVTVNTRVNAVRLKTYA